MGTMPEKSSPIITNKASKTSADPTDSAVQHFTIANVYAGTAYLLWI
jgi:hypothetical protein